MAKSLRAKTKQANRRKKRQDEGSYYAAVEAARLKAVSDRLLGKEKKEGDDEEMMEDDDVEGGAEGADGSGEATKKISTSGPRENRRSSWRASKGLDPRPNKKGQNKQLAAPGRSKAGKPKRRR